MLPYLFILCMEWLSLTISERVDKYEWKLIHITRGVIGISYLLLVDDISLFSEAKSSQMCVILEVLKEFERVSSLSVNADKLKAMVS